MLCRLLPPAFSRGIVNKSQGKRYAMRVSAFSRRMYEEIKSSRDPRDHVEDG